MLPLYILMAITMIVGSLGWIGGAMADSKDLKRRRENAAAVERGDRLA